MNESKKFTKGDWTTCYYSICEILCNDELLFTVATDDADKIIELLEEYDKLKQTIDCHTERIQILMGLLDLADMIIDLSDDEKAKDFWGNKNRSSELKWKEILKKYGVEC